MWKYLIITIFLSIASLCQASYDMNARCKKAYASVLRLEMRQAQELLDQEKINNPNNLIPIYIEGYIDFLNTLTLNTKNPIQKQLKRFQDRIELLEDGDNKSPYHLYCLGESRLFMGLLKIKNNQLIQAAFDLNKAYRFFERNADKYPNFIPNKLPLSVMHTVIGSVPENYKWGVELLNFKGSVEQGIAGIEAMYAKSISNQDYEYLHELSLVLLSILEINYHSEHLNKEKIITAFENVKNIHTNPTLVYTYANFLIRTSENDMAIELIEKYSPKNSQTHIPNIDYLYGQALLRKNDPKSGAVFSDFVKNYPGKNYIKSGLRYLAWSYLLNGDTLTYRETIKKCLTLGDDFIDQDKVARSEAESKSIPNVAFIKVGLFFDGGYYKKALTSLKSINVNTLSEDKKIEYLYRHGGIYDKMGKDSHAIHYYKMTIEKGKDSKLYFAANASLKLGAIYEKKGDLRNAKKYYRMVRSMKNTQYKNSIAHKAKISLQRIESKP